MADTSNKELPPGFEPVDGALVAARILSRMPSNRRTDIIKAIQASDSALAENVQEKLYNIRELTSLSSKAAQVLVREVNHKDLVMSMRSAPTDVQKILLSNMSERKRQMVIDDAKYISDTEPKHLKEAQWRVLEKLAELQEKGVVPKIQTKILA